MTIRIPTDWRRRSDLELAGLVRAIFEGRILGSWQLADNLEVDWVFPGFLRYQHLAFNAELGFETNLESPELERALASGPPRPRAAFARIAGGRGARGATTSELPIAADWDVLSAEEWERLRVMLGYPPRQAAARRIPPEIMEPAVEAAVC